MPFFIPHRHRVGVDVTFPCSPLPQATLQHYNFITALYMWLPFFVPIVNSLVGTTFNQTMVKLRVIVLPTLFHCWDRNQAQVQTNHTRPTRSHMDEVNWDDEDGSRGVGGEGEEKREKRKEKEGRKDLSFI